MLRLPIFSRNSDFLLLGFFDLFSLATKGVPFCHNSDFLIINIFAEILGGRGNDCLILDLN